MPAILVASKMKSGLPKPRPVHSALPVPQAPGRRPPLATPKSSSLVAPRHPSTSHPAPGHVRLGWGPLKSMDAVPPRKPGEDTQVRGLLIRGRRVRFAKGVRVYLHVYIQGV